MAKNIVICCDGTSDEYGENNTNVVKLFDMLVKHDPSVQVAFYDPGVGTFGADVPWRAVREWTRLKGLAFGWGLTRNIQDSYRYLMERYTEGDKIFLFGFSRGAFTARALAGMIHRIGILQRGSDNLTPYAVKMWKKDNQDLSTGFARTFSHRCRINFVGVWDTVKSVGRPTLPDVFPFSQSNPSVDTFRHAVAIDERRCWFPTFPCLGNRYAPGQSIREVWFPGMHSDVGGGELESESGLSKGALLWMVHEAMQHGLLVDQARLAAIIPPRGSQAATYSPPDPLAPAHESLRSWWWIPECLPSPDLRGSRDLQVGERAGLWVPSLGRRRRVIPEGAILHQAVLDRKNGRHDYKPTLPRQYTVEPWPPSLAAGTS